MGRRGDGKEGGEGVEPPLRLEEWRGEQEKMVHSVGSSENLS